MYRRTININKYIYLYILLFCHTTGWPPLKKINENQQLGTGFFVHHRIVSGIRGVEFVSDRMSYVVLRGRKCGIIVLNVHAPSEEKIDDSKYSSCDELEQDFDYFPKRHMTVLLENFNAKVGRESIFSNRQL